MGPGFPVGGGANPPGGANLHTIFAKLSYKLHEIEKILVRGGGTLVGGAPLSSTTENSDGPMTPPPKPVKNLTKNRMLTPIG